MFHVRSRFYIFETNWIPREILTWSFLAKNFIFFLFLDWDRKMADLNEQDLLDYDEEEQEVKDIKTKKDVKVN